MKPIDLDEKVDPMQVKRELAELLRIPLMHGDGHEWNVIAWDVCVGEGKRVNIMECKSCGKLKIV